MVDAQPEIQAHYDTAEDEKNAIALDAPLDILDAKKWDDIKAQHESDEEFQHNIPLWTAIKTYRAAIGWSMVAASCVVMDGFDTLILGNSYAVHSFQKQFGVPYKGGYQVPAKWQAGCSQASSVGNIMGCFIGAYLVDRFGYRRTLMAGLVFLVPFIGMAAFAPTLTVLLVAEILCGIPWGMFSTLGPAYASEVCPLSVRAYLTAYTNLCWVFGHFIGAGVLLGTQKLDGVWGYRIPFVLQWIWPLPIFTLLWFAPESPWWLVRRERFEEAEHCVRRLAVGQAKERAKDTVAGMVRTNKLEADVQAGTTFAELFKGTDRRRTEITCVIWMFTGLGFSGNSTYYFEQAGLPTTDAFAMTMVTYALGAIGTVCAWFLITRAGRRTIVLIGLCWLGVGMLVIGGLSVAADHGHTGARWGQAAMMLVWVFSLQLTIGSLAYTIIGETSSTRLRNKTIGLGRVAYSICGIGFGIMTPYMINPTAWNWKGKTGFFIQYGPLNFLCAIYVFYRLPEMKGRSYYELDILFERRISARKFSSTVVEQDADDHNRAALMQHADGSG